MSPNCPHCGAPLFTPEATMCAGCALDVNVWETSCGNLRRVWLYDRVVPPEICVTCYEAFYQAATR